MSTPAAAGVVGVIAVPIFAIILLTAGGGAQVGALAGTSQAPPSATAISDIPPNYLTLYEAAAQTCEGLPWTVLAGIGKVETDHGRDIAISPAGAEGPMQFLPSTFVEFATDGDGDGIADINDPADAIYSTAKMLCADGAKNGQDLQGAIFAYNHDTTYVQDVLGWAVKYGGLTGVGSATAAANIAISFAEQQLGKPYVFGANGPDAWDCSSLVQAAYAAAGISIPRTTFQWAGTGPVVWQAPNTIPQPVPLSLLQPGDLLYSPGSDGTPTNPGHVAMYVGGGQEIEAPHTGDVVKITALANDLVDVTRPSAQAGQSGAG